MIRTVPSAGCGVKVGHISPRLCDILRAALISRSTARVILVGLTISLIVGLIIVAGSALAPFLIGSVLVYLLLPAVNALDRWMPRWAAILLLYVAGLLVVITLLILLVPSLISQTIRLTINVARPDQLEQLMAQIVVWYQTNVPREFQSPLEQILRASLPGIQANLSTLATTTATFLLGQIRQVFSWLSFVVGLLIVPIWAFYVLNDVRKVRLFINRQLHYRIRADFWNVWSILDRALSAYVRGQLLLALIIGIAAAVSLLVINLAPGMKVDYILPLALWAGIAELVPMIGATLGAIPAVIVTLFVGGLPSALAVLIAFTIIQLVENNLLVPRVIGDSVGVHPAILIIMLVIFGKLFGLLGVIVAAPATAAARDLYRYAYHRLSNRSPAEARALVLSPARPVARPDRPPAAAAFMRERPLP
ncbi:MAG: AI-2E family transporter [Candidatus Thermofonsia Clade 3 bacterium]|uniref:AI-2E family transporter n=1 Tax=Candidatus Thermofonsia Clade 3 bacterium TaxID=2364212 RepID=A0A2M8QE04_9CHLR|nr:MAG: AI-2E family transporter [Candidatus Thermofonsia Clade 3 bacterium]